VNYDGPYLEPWWQAELDTIAPPGTRLSWLKMVWVAGDAHEPINRWVIHQMMPLDRTPGMVRDDLLGPSPRVRGRYDQVLKRFIPDPNCNISFQQWQLFQDTRCWARPYWIVQGSGGGHKKSFNRVESVISRMHGGPKEPPSAGDLPYAAPDHRTFRQIAELDLMRTYGYLLDRDNSKEQHERFTEDQKNAMSARIWKWLEGQVRDVLSDERAGSRALWEAGRNSSYNEAALEAAIA
jgi:hypothetical protein